MNIRDDKVVNTGKSRCVDKLDKLEDVLNPDYGVSLSTENKRNGVTSGLVKITCKFLDGSDLVTTNGHGLLLTADGFLMTVHHVVSIALQRWKIHPDNIPLDIISKLYKISDTRGGEYPLDITFAYTEKGNDFILLKAVLPEDYPFQKVVLGDNLSMGDSIYSVRLGEGFVDIKPTRVLYSTPRDNIFLTEEHSQKGRSGSPYINASGEVVGLLTGSIDGNSSAIHGEICKSIIRKGIEYIKR